jgi:hypothetical protein
VKTALQKHQALTEAYQRELGTHDTSVNDLRHRYNDAVGSIGDAGLRDIIVEDFHSVTDTAKQLKTTIAGMTKPQRPKMPGDAGDGTFHYTDAAAFEKEAFERRRKSVSEGVTFILQTAAERAAAMGWTPKPQIETFNRGRTVYGDGSSYYSVDTQHGRFEKTNLSGKHQGEVNFDGAEISALDRKHG